MIWSAQFISMSMEQGLPLNADNCLWVLRLSQQLWFKLRSSGLWCHLVL